MIEIKTKMSMSGLAKLISEEVLSGTAFEEFEDWGVPTCEFHGVLGMRLKLVSQGNNVDYLLHINFDFLPDRNERLSGFKEKMQIYLADLLTERGIETKLKLPSIEEVRAAMMKPKTDADGNPRNRNPKIRKRGD